MPVLEPIIDHKADHMVELWAREQCFRYYVGKRRECCIHTQLLDLTLMAPMCEECIQNEPWWMSSLPDISKSNWEFDTAWSVGLGALKRTKAARRKNRNFAWPCKRCGGGLQPWRGDDVWVVSYHLEDHYNVPLVPGKKAAGKKLRDQLFRLYEFRCFGCDKKQPLHLDHIQPQSKGGLATFRNLQPLCDACGQQKADAEPEDVTVDDDMYFRRPPSDCWEDMFW